MILNSVLKKTKLINNIIALFVVVLLKVHLIKKNKSYSYKVLIKGWNSWKYRRGIHTYHKIIVFFVSNISPFLMTTMWIKMEFFTTMCSFLKKTLQLYCFINHITLCTELWRKCCDTTFTWINTAWKCDRTFEYHANNKLTITISASYII